MTIPMPDGLLRVALPSKGALADGATKLLTEAGYDAEPSGRELHVVDERNGVVFFRLRPRDIATYVAAGTVDVGLTGRDLLADSGASVETLLPLGFGRARFWLAAPVGRPLDLRADPPPRIATAYPKLLQQHLDGLGSLAVVVVLDGAVEIAPQLGVADAIADVVQTGATLRAAGLELVGEPILESEAVLVSTSAVAAAPPQGIQRLVERAKGVVTARTYVLVDYDLPSHLLDAATEITPGIEAPTVSPLSTEGWVAVRVLVPRREHHEVADRLSALGAEAILVSDLRTCRL